MGTCHSMPSLNPPLYETFPTYVAAGVLFTDTVTALAGTQRRKKNLSGFGGKREPADKDWLDTAWRETAEELLGWDNVSRALLHTFRTTLPIRNVHESAGYVIVQCSFETLNHFLCICARQEPSPLYNRNPLTLLELILDRDPNAYGEIGGLALLPVSPNPCVIDRLFQGDLARCKVNRILRDPCLPQSEHQ